MKRAVHFEAPSTQVILPVRAARALHVLARCHHLPLRPRQHSVATRCWVEVDADLVFVEYRLVSAGPLGQATIRALAPALDLSATSGDPICSNCRGRSSRVQVVRFHPNFWSVPLI